eukprot:CAMPEP_0202509580 /NCGR_PEP_ID=MMETSP1361-20130828/52847_1 /ASSEMBLY_ACC=CAM_ASM_000849 /TAXON_ID=210615 /ORGANISM="Staurosira complex sp., Strain CCMP2646" /LENGTH=547 /DNA_ID=CAMNT_0049143807 /DNA_START=319 /DNA_END=1963 /DNA_ORIENTATION=-
MASMLASGSPLLTAVDPTIVQASVVAVESSMFEESFVESVVSLPAVWSAAVMVTLVGLLEAWEKALHFARDVTPPAVQKVLDDLVGEISSLGFIGLVLTFLLSKLALGDVVGGISKRYLGNEEALLEDFHFWHETFFQCAITFCVSAAVMVLQVIRTVKEVSDLAEDQIRKQGNRSGSDELAMEEYESLLKLQHADETESVLWHELTLTQEERGAEALIIRARLEREFNLPRHFRIEQAIEYAVSDPDSGGERGGSLDYSCTTGKGIQPPKTFSDEQAIEYAVSGERVNFFKIRPTSWLLLVPVLAIINSVDIAHHVVNSGSANSAASSGYFFGTPSVVIPFAIYMTLKGAWGVFNYWKMAAIKSMLVPRLQLQSDNTLRIIPPRVESPKSRRAFTSTPDFLKPLEELAREPPTTRVEELFGRVGKGGPAFYLESIKLHTWICVASLIGFGAQIIPRDLYVLTHADTTAGRPDLLVPEIVFFSGIVVFNLFQLWLAPKTFLNFMLIECVNNLVSANEGVDSSVWEESITDATAQLAVNQTDTKDSFE